MTILVACHKPDFYYEDDVYIPIHVGRAMSAYKKQMHSMIGDDTGINISNKNPYYCELTAQYWALHNIECEYIGFCHYRRYFKNKITINNIDDLMKGYDIILPKPYYVSVPIVKWFADTFTYEDTYIFIEGLKQMWPNYKDEIDKFFYKNNYLYPCNMFICKKSLFEDYSKWQFESLFRIEELLKFSDYSRLKRIMGYFGENMITLYSAIHQLRIKEIPLVNMVEDNKYILKQSFLQRIYCRILLRIYKMIKGRWVWNYAALNGLEADGIIDKIKNIRRK